MIEISTESISIKTQRRTWRINIESPRGESPVITGHREEIKINAGDGTVISREQNISRIDRQLADVADEKVTLTDGKTTLTVAQIIEGIRAYLDQCETDELAAKAAEEKAAVAANAAAQPAVPPQTEI